MTSVLDTAFETMIGPLSGTKFQDFIDELYSAYYGARFTCIRPYRDKGCDGILDDKCIIACYGPERYSKADFEEKIDGDFASYRRHWRAKHSDWQVVYNGKFMSGMVLHLKKLKADTIRTGLPDLMHMVRDLHWPQKRHLARFLGIDEQYLVNDVLAEILDDMLQRPSSRTPIIRPRTPTDIGRKIELNYSRRDVDTAKEEHRDCAIDFPILGALLRGYDEAQIRALKSGIQTDFLGLHGMFGEKLKKLTDLYSKAHVADAMYRRHVRVVLIFFFEQCVIGRRTPEDP